MKKPRASSPIKERFEQHFTPEPNSGCWLWTGSVVTSNTGSAYGSFHMMKSGKSSSEPAHRVSWKIYRHPIPKGKVVCHKCDVGVCVNPDHLFIGTQADNLSDMKRKGRSAFGDRKKNAKLTDFSARVIRRLSGRISNIGISKIFGVSSSLIDGIQNNKRWQHIAARVTLA